MSRRVSGEGEGDRVAPVPSLFGPSVRSKAYSADLITLTLGAAAPSTCPARAAGEVTCSHILDIAALTPVKAGL